MLAEELIRQLNVRYGFTRWPETFEVNTETYAYACLHVIKHKQQNHEPAIVLSFGPHKGLMFKGIELIEKKGK